MHRALSIPEIFDTICAEFSRRHLNPFNLKELTSPALLASLAQTCCLFQEITLDHLWSEVHNLCNLVKCMPSDLWDLSMVEN